MAAGVVVDVVRRVRIWATSVAVSEGIWGGACVCGGGGCCCS
jgi:hypothetical protein